MQSRKTGLILAGVIGTLVATACTNDSIAGPDPSAISLARAGTPGGGGGGGGGGDEGAGNNLSFPVVWAEGVTKTLRGTMGVVTTDGAWWWWWGTTTDDTPLSCAPDPDEAVRCDDGIPGKATGIDPSVSYPGAIRKAYLQKDLLNEWQAGSLSAAGTGPVVVDSVDWGDDLEAKDWSLTSMVRLEHVLTEVLASTLTEYTMRHTSGWGIDEVHGLSVTPGAPDQVEALESTRATVFSSCARLTIQRLTVPRETLDPTSLSWSAASKQWVGTTVRDPIFNLAVHEAQDGPGFFNAEINVKGKIIYGYTWNLKKMNDGAGDYRVTFSFDAACGTVSLNTMFDATTVIVESLEEEEVVVAAEPVSGGTGVLVPGDNLTYMDVRILGNKGGGKGGRGSR